MKSRGQNVETVDNRRPLKVREIGLAKWIARKLSQKNITPNQISIASIIFAVLAAGSLLSIPQIDSWVLPIMAAVFIQCRLLCNLFDGMVAVEGGKGTPSGELFNDIPDRIADPLILVAAGYAITTVEWGGSLGWFAGLMAVMTAYVRTLATAIGAPGDFGGPMAKQHRMALMTFACILAAMETSLWSKSTTFIVALLLISVGSAVTVWRRTKVAYRFLETTHGRYPRT